MRNTHRVVRANCVSLHHSPLALVLRGEESGVRGNRASPSSLTPAQKRELKPHQPPMCNSCSKIISEIWLKCPLQPQPSEINDLSDVSPRVPCRCGEEFTGSGENTLWQVNHSLDWFSGQTRCATATRLMSLSFRRPIASIRVPYLTHPDCVRRPVHR